jgi:hypothetical protein
MPCTKMLITSVDVFHASCVPHFQHRCVHILQDNWTLYLLFQMLAFLPMSPYTYIFLKESMIFKGYIVFYYLAISYFLGFQI